MPLRSSIIYLLFSLIFICASLDARSAVWKPERMPGSARLGLEDIRYLFVPSDPSDVLSAAVKDMVGLWPAQIEIKQMSEEPAPSKQSLVLVRDLPVLRSLSFGGFPLRSEDAGGFSIRRDRTRVYLRASSDEGLTNGLYAICRELLGARWYWGGDLGFERVGEVADKFPDRMWREQPAFVQRTLHPFETDFGRRNRLNRKYSFNHNLARVFTQEFYEASPEAFAEINGQRQPPRRNPKYDAQPDFTEPKAVELAAKAARAHFEEYPNATSYSLSINDNSLFDESEETRAIVMPLEYFRGRPNYTDLVFAFMNRVAEEVFRDSSMLETASGEDRYLTALAYYWTEQSPSFKIHPRVMPVLTSDRAQWHDPVYREEDKDLIQRWANSGSERIATWDYYYGVPMPYPRQMTHWIGESIKFLNNQGVDAFYSSMPSMWGLDGPKAWLAAELLWDPDQDVEVLLDEFYSNFFGPAAKPIREFYEIAEQTRNEREGPANWIKFFKDEAGIELFPSETLVRMRECIDDAEDKLDIIGSETRASALREPQGLEPVEMASGSPTKGNRFAKRVQVVSEAFSYTESYANYHRRRTGLAEMAMAVLSEDAGVVAGEELVVALADYQSAKASFNQLKNVLVQNPMHSGFKTFNRLMQSEPVELAMAALAWSDYDLEKIESENASALLPVIRDWHAGDARYVRSGKNPSLKHSGQELRNFLGPEVPVMDAWRIQYRASEGLRIESAEGANGEGLRIENADIVSLAQTCPVMGEKFYLLQIEASWQVSPDNRTWIQLNWESIGGEDLQMDLLLRLPNGTSEGSQRLQFAFQAPANAYDLKVGIVTNRQCEGDYLEIKRIELGSLMPKR